VNERASPTEFSVRSATWAVDAEALSSVRTEVFVLEQGVERDHEIDGIDPACRHALAVDSNGSPIGTARVDDRGHIGRVAVRARWRRKGVASRLMDVIVDEARNAGHTRVELNAQLSAIPFYASLGFEPRGDVFVEAGIEHQNMVLGLG
jgi:predicted GNAT family N-acyltransferase